MSIEAEKESVLEEVKDVTNKYNKDGVMTKPSVRYYSAREKAERVEELALYEAQLNQPAWMRSGSDEQRAITIRRVKDLKQQMAKHAAPEVSGETRDALYKRREELKTKIRVGMNPHEVQRRNPVGAVDRHMEWEKKNKNNILEYKNIQRVLEPDDESKDLANIEMLRPSMATPGSDSTYMADAQIPGIFGYHSVPEENWKAAMPDSPTSNTALKQVERQEQEAERPEPETVERTKSGRKAMSAENKAKLAENLARARARRKANKEMREQEAKAQPQPTGIYAAEQKE
tara:strand:- start:7972 stop:8835 length:864 start_codon:yes stop_codon:yes gene_type:complete